MLIFLDSNIICADYKMKSPSFEVAQKVGTIVLGQIVVDEVCNKYRENLEEKAAKTKKAILELNDPLFTPHIVWRELDVSDECSKYKDFLEMFIIESGMTVAEPYPQNGHEFTLSGLHVWGSRDVIPVKKSISYPVTYAILQMQTIRKNCIRICWQT